MADPIRNLLDELNAALDASGEQSAEVKKNLNLPHACLLVHEEFLSRFQRC